MSVLSKALHLAVFACLVSGCAVNTPGTQLTRDGSENTPATDQAAISADATAQAAPQGTTDTTANLASASSEQNIPTAGVAQQAAVTTTTSVENLRFAANQSKDGQISIGLSAPARFDISQTAPSEYTLTIANATATERTRVPQVAPVGYSGIRTARAVQSGNDVLVRMFVDGGVALNATRNGTEILVTASRTPTQVSDPDARAQLQPVKGGEAKPTVVEKGAAKDANKDSVKVTESDDEAARKNPTGIPSADGSKIYTGRLISLDLQETDIDNALRIIAEVSNLNIIASDDVTGKVTLRLIDVPWDQALDVILKTNGLDQVTEGNVIRIAPVDKLRQEREALREAKKAAENLEDLKVKYVRVSYARATEMKDQVTAVLSERGSVAVDERTNQLIIKDITKGHEEALQLIKKLDLRTPQVLLETQIVEASRDLLRDLGFQWNFNYLQSPATGNATGLNFPNSIQVGSGSNDFGVVSFPAAISPTGGTSLGVALGSADGSRALAARLTALEQDKKVRVISRPQVATVNNKQAQIKSVETVRVKVPSSGTSVATGAGAQASGGASSAFQEFDVGITLKVTPQASPDYYVLMDVFAKSSIFGGHTTDGVPSTVEREATSTILVKSGQTFALGGVYRLNDQDTVTGIPFLKDLPVFGGLFSRNNIDKSDEELIFFITPHIVEGSFDPSLM